MNSPMQFLPTYEHEVLQTFKQRHLKILTKQFSAYAFGTLDKHLHQICEVPYLKQQF